MYFMRTGGQWERTDDKIKFDLPANTLIYAEIVQVQKSFDFLRLNNFRLSLQLVELHSNASSTRGGIIKPTPTNLLFQ